MNEKVKLLAKDLTHEFPRSPRELMAGYVIAARAVDKCRAELTGHAGEYEFGSPLDMFFLDYAEIPLEDFKTQVASGATDAELSDWIASRAKARPRVEIIKWNNSWRDKRISELPDAFQEYFEDYIHQFLRKNRPVYHLFDIFDVEEQRL